MFNIFKMIILIFIVLSTFISGYCTDTKYGNYCNFGHIFRSGIKPIDELDEVCYRKSICITGTSTWCECQALYRLMRIQSTSDDKECLLYWNTCNMNTYYYGHNYDSILISNGGDGWNFYTIFNDDNKTYRISVNDTMYLSTYDKLDTYLESASRAINEPDIFRNIPFMKTITSAKIIVLSNQLISSYKRYNLFNVEDITLETINKKNITKQYEKIISDIRKNITKQYEKIISDVSKNITDQYEKIISDVSKNITDHYEKIISGMGKKTNNIMWTFIISLLRNISVLIMIMIILCTLSIGYFKRKKRLNERIEETFHDDIEK